ncbi:hypothetical protein EDD86DRAFT_246568 [Gorgonomyces haynaldii]|nr:hypothetical protein EDD86DRAFT_246568 [Gorgonomyces haynaldii]
MSLFMAKSITILALSYCLQLLTLLYFIKVGVKMRNKSDPQHLLIFVSALLTFLFNSVRVVLGHLDIAPPPAFLVMQILALLAFVTSAVMTLLMTLEVLLPLSDHLKPVYIHVAEAIYLILQDTLFYPLLVASLLLVSIASPYILLLLTKLIKSSEDQEIKQLQSKNIKRLMPSSFLICFGIVTVVAADPLFSEQLASICFLNLGQNCFVNAILLTFPIRDNIKQMVSLRTKKSPCQPLRTETQVEQYDSRLRSFPVGPNTTVM